MAAGSHEPDAANFAHICLGVDESFLRFRGVGCRFHVLGLGFRAAATLGNLR